MINQLKEIIEELKQFNTTVSKKAMHHNALYQIKKIYDKAEDVCCVYGAEYRNEFVEYKLAILTNKPKKVLDHKLSYCKTSLGRDLSRHVSELLNNDLKEN